MHIHFKCTMEQKTKIDRILCNITNSFERFEITHDHNGLNKQSVRER